MKHIVAATDLSRRSETAVARAMLLARRFGASLTVLHVVDDELPARLFEAERARAQEFLDGFVAGLPGADGVAVAVRAVGGLDFRAIVDTADAEDASLIVLGAHRRNLIKDVFTGTTVERVVRSTARPVLVAKSADPADYVCTLTAVDLTAEAAEAVRLAHRMARGQTLYLLHVIDDTVTLQLKLAEVGSAEVERHRHAVEERCRQLIDAIAGEAGLRAGEYLPVVEWSAPVPRLLDTAATFGADLAVVGTRTHAKGAVERLLLGSFAEQALRDLPCDVLAVPLDGSTALPGGDAVSGMP
ncbi:universal stress protein [Azospirillum halopraeferens]|uniref:universal stress protein n=1 Tax=Azospirillum halopraeferens TaxID=34010 RepID=UPI000426113A|nr:universal stress protein [Azospirillum halopraeferens]